MKKNEDLVKAWYYVDRTVKNYDNAEMTPGLRRLVPEWYDKGTGQVNLKPTSRDLGRGNLVKGTARRGSGEADFGKDVRWSVYGICYQRRKPL